jgi:hypothetical protein
MKKLILGLIVYLCCAFVPVRNVSSSTTITSSDDGGIVVNTGGSATFTLGSVSSGFSCVVSNHGTGIVTFSGSITVANGKTITTLTNNRTEFNPNGLGNSIQLWYDGTTWRGR